jgi:membrane-bound lytic murein transglycosylase A
MRAWLRPAAAGLRSRALTGALLLALAGCAQQHLATGGSQAMQIRPVGYDHLPGWQQDRVSEAMPAFLASCAAMDAAGQLQPGLKLGGQGDTAALGGSPVQWRPACDAAREVPPGDDAAARRFVEAWFQPYAVAGTSPTAGLFTGYYEPEVPGARSPGGRWRVPLYSRPRDMVSADLSAFGNAATGRPLQGRIIEGQVLPVSDPLSAGIAQRSLVTVDASLFPRGATTVVGRIADGKLVPYFTRAQIESGVLLSRRLGLIWLDDPVDALFLQIQGAGRIRLPDGKVARVTYDGKNGWPYVPIGRVLADRGEIPLEQVTMQSIRAWLESHPRQSTEVMDQNPSYVFFREIIGVRPDQGPPGTLGAPLVPGRSLAVDRDFIPLGAPVYIDTTDPVSGQPLRRLVLAMDTGGAITGPVRGDLFFGWGPEAELKAGQMNRPGADWVLLPRPPARTAQR